ncbi:hypothetical protein CEXT_779691 [Caerostris extrusa]|uniref:Uncharacterized protein n=1 Tax=Caerostris extrusa TaxID=172846 RepID=A0AAV4VTQ5_CAEEX|nr:hypothetical protein CEXT_779691 [Caerostris extrusa]
MERSYKRSNFSTHSLYRFVLYWSDKKMATVSSDRIAYSKPGTKEKKSCIYSLFPRGMIAANAIVWFCDSPIYIVKFPPSDRNARDIDIRIFYTCRGEMLMKIYE